MAQRDLTLTSAYISPGQAALLRKEHNGQVAMLGRYDQQVANNLVRAGLLRHRHGLMYDVTPRGADVVAELRALDAEAA